MAGNAYCSNHSDAHQEWVVGALKSAGFHMSASSNMETRYYDSRPTLIHTRRLTLFIRGDTNDPVGGGCQSQQVAQQVARGRALNNRFSRDES